MTNRDFFAQMISGEFERFRNVIAALPADKLDYKPDPKARTAGELVGHMIGHNEDLVELMTKGHINHRMTVEFQSLDDAVSKFEKSYREVEAGLKAISEEAWMKAGDFKVGDHVAMSAPAQSLAWMLFMDSVHHRGQLSTHIRPMGGKVPSIYGPSADSPPPS